MNRPLLSCWIDEAFRLEEENRELRGALTSLLFWLASNRDLLDLAYGDVEARWPEEGAA